MTNINIFYNIQVKHLEVYTKDHRYFFIQYKGWNQEKNLIHRNCQKNCPEQVNKAIDEHNAKWKKKFKFKRAVEHNIENLKKTFIFHCDKKIVQNRSIHKINSTNILHFTIVVKINIYN